MQLHKLKKKNKLSGGSFEEHAIFSDVLLGIKHVIQSHLYEVQHKYEEQLKSYESEIHHRDVVIEDLRHRVHDLGGSSPDRIPGIGSNTGNGSTGSSGDIPFVVRNYFEFPSRIHFILIEIKIKYLNNLLPLYSVVIHWTQYLHHHRREPIANVMAASNPKRKNGIHRGSVIS